MHLSLAEMITAAIEDEGIAPAALLDATQLTGAELEGIEEGDTTDLTKLAKIMHTLGRRLVINPDFSVQVYPHYEPESSFIQLNSHTNLRPEPMHLPARAEITVQRTPTEGETSATTTDMLAPSELSHAS